MGTQCQEKCKGKFEHGYENTKRDSIGMKIKVPHEAGLSNKQQTIPASPMRLNAGIFYSP
jgi:hypothetical protein